MASTFDDFLAAGKIDTKDVCVNGLEIKVRSLTAAETFRAAEIEQKIKDGKAGVEDGTLYLLQTAIADPKLTEDQVKQLGGLSSKFVTELAQAVAKVISPEGAEALAEKN